LPDLEVVSFHYRYLENELIWLPEWSKVGELNAELSSKVRVMRLCYGGVKSAPISHKNVQKSPA
jgi:hypothetical protein